MKPWVRAKSLKSAISIGKLDDEEAKTKWIFLYCSRSMTSEDDGCHFIFYAPVI